MYRDQAGLEIRYVRSDSDPWLQTWTGRAFYPLTPRTADIDVRDIAHALSLLCRYGGHTRRHLSVAEHCVLMSWAVAPENALWALLHDATEAYLGDVVGPVKVYLPQYRIMESRLMEVICRRFDLPVDEPRQVREADTRIRLDERAALMALAPMPWPGVDGLEPLGVTVVGWSAEAAETAFLARFNELTFERAR